MEVRAGRESSQGETTWVIRDRTLRGGAVSHDLIPVKRAYRELIRRKIAIGIAILLVMLSVPAVMMLESGAAPISPVSLFSGSAGPDHAASDTQSVEVGVRFRSSVAGAVTAIRYFKGAGSPQAKKAGHLWDRSGRLLAAVQFASETSSGWQEASLSSSVNIAANTIYVVSYFAPQGGYVSTHDYFKTAVVSGPLTAPASNNGVFCYASASCYPTQTYMASNYFADLVFLASTTSSTTTTAATTTTPPTISTTTSMSTTTTAPAATTTTTTTTPHTTTTASTTTTTVPGGGATFTVTDGRCQPAAGLVFDGVPGLGQERRSVDGRCVR